MKVFLSWAGDESRQLAVIFEKWLKMVLQSSKPWMSTNINKGEGWDKEIHSGLKETKVGILFLTKQSIESIYLHYEAGAIANVEDSLVCTFLYNLKPADLKQPLARFQTTQFDKNDVFKLVQDINKKIIENDGNIVTDEALQSIFEITWPRLESEINAITNHMSSTPTSPVRSDREILEEILEAIRTLKQPATASKAYGINELQLELELLQHKNLIKNLNAAFPKTMAKAQSETNNTPPQRNSETLLKMVTQEIESSNMKEGELLNNVRAIWESLHRQYDIITDYSERDVARAIERYLAGERLRW